MNSEQKKAALKVLAKDCAISSKYIDSDANTCAIGALAQASCLSDDVLRNAHIEKIYALFGNNTAVYTMQAAIQTKFGLDRRELGGIQFANDGVGGGLAGQKQRREAVLAYVKALPVTDTPSSLLERIFG